jgi:hypothetical protein
MIQTENKLKTNKLVYVLVQNLILTKEKQNEEHPSKIDQL